MAATKYPGTSGGAVAPVTSGKAITPSDSTDFADGATRGIYVGTAGNLTVIFKDDDESVPLTNVAVGEHPFAVRRVLSTGTTATGLVALR